MPTVTIEQSTINPLCVRFTVVHGAWKALTETAYLELDSAYGLALRIMRTPTNKRGTTVRPEIEWQMRDALQAEIDRLWVEHGT